ncbi:hypothetical protein BV898_09468 [Hypsibius exemplaris]|uniref:Uncharacterized protein n=1 Tax=Hypsibius exemplaris TaxID=2072580 RepID=A0A1W0WMQ6_HYPEX|nr:hypothetical protein BV898_09468 [Hypsibius exemplaris]
MERSVLVVIFVMAAVLVLKLGEVQAAPLRPLDYPFKFRPSQGLGVGFPIPRRSAMPRPPPLVIDTSSTATICPPYEQEQSASNMLKRDELFSAPANWFLPSSRNWPNFPSLTSGVKQTDAATKSKDFIDEHALDDFTPENGQESMIWPPTNYLRFG